MFAFGLSERDHGADIYSTDMVLTPDGDGFRASGGKYYIGNGNVAGMVSVFGRRSDIEGPEGYVFFAADSRHPAYKLVKNIVAGQMYVSAFDLVDYPVAPQDVLHTGVAAFEAALNTINVGKFNLGFCAIGMAEHAFHETITQAENRILFGGRVTEFGQVRRILTEAYARLLAAKLYGARAVDYVRSASLEDRRYLLYTPLNKMRVTMEGERIINLLGRGDLGQGLRARQLLRDRQARHRRAAEARGHGARQPRAGAEVPAQLPVRQRRARAAAGAPRRRRRRLPVPPGADPRAGQDHVPRLAAGVRRLRARAERRALPRAGRRARHAAAAGAADGGADQGRPRLPAVPGADLHARARTAS